MAEKMTGSEVVRWVKQELSSLTGLEANTVSALRRDDEGWHITVEMIDMKRIPNSTDVLDSYECLMDDAGSLISYRRTRRYCRADAMEEESVEAAK